MENNVNFVDPFTSFNSKLARLKQHSLKLTKEEYTMNDSSKSDEESSNVKMKERAYPKYKDDVDESRALHIQDLCPADKKRIAQLVDELAKCAQEKHKAEADLALMKSENESLQNQFELLSTEHEQDKNQLKSKLSDTTASMNKLKFQISHSLKLLTNRIKVQEMQFFEITNTVKDLLREKIQLQNALFEKEMKLRVAEAKIERTKESMEMEKLLLTKQQIKSSRIETSDKECQTQDKFERTEFNTASFLPQSNVRSVEYESVTNFKHKLPKIVHTKHDLDAPSLEAALLRELFFKRPNINEANDFDIFSVLPEN